MTREQDGERNEEATPYKLEEARRKGSVARSTDLQSFVAIAVAAVAAFSLLEPALRALMRLMSQFLSAEAARFESTDRAAAALQESLVQAVLVAAPVFFALLVAVVVAGLVQTRGLLISTAPITPDFNRLDPVAGLKRLFSVKILFESGKNMLKLAVLVAVAWTTVAAAMPGLESLGTVSAKSFLLTLVDSSASLLARLCAVLGAFALLDILFARWEFHRGMRMSRREQEEEHKNRDGDPRIKARLKELRQEYLKRARAVTRVPEADVLLTNPTHVAVAVKYEHGVSPAPQVIAKGAGSLARRMRDLAYRNQVPVVQSPPLARALYKEVEQDHYLPEKWYPEVARILVWVQAAKSARRRAVPSPARSSRRAAP